MRTTKVSAQDYLLRRKYADLQQEAFAAGGGLSGDWTVTPEGIYYIHRYDEIGKPANTVSIDFIDFAKREKKTVATLPHDPTSNLGLNISLDGKWLIYSIDDY